VEGRDDRPATVVDVARLAGVSRQTVSNVLNAPERVRATTRERVEDAIARLDYRPHRLAQNFKAGTTGLLGYRVPPGGESINPVLDRFLHALTDAARDAGYHVLLFTPESGQGETEILEELIATRTVDGFVVSETNYGDERIRYLAGAGVPFVTFGRTDLDVDHTWVDVDGAAGTAAAVAHLVERGHRRIAYLGWPAGSVSGDQRALGYRGGLELAGIDPDPDLDVRGPDGVDLGPAALSAWLSRRHPPTAVVAASDLLALGVQKAARAAGLLVGPELAVTGFDDTPVAPFMSPPLTSVRQPLAAVAATVVRLLVDRIAGNEAHPTGLALRPDLIVRNSTERTAR
jgi:LacI family transcriptional regulator